VVHAALAIPLADGIPLDRACLLGCGVSTGVGAAIQTAKVWPGASVAVIGLGGIGLAAMQGARIAGAERLIAIDIASTKFGWAATFGATDVVDASSVDPVQAVLDLTGGAGVDFAFEATGIPACVGQAVEMLAYAGTAVAIGVPPIPSEVVLPWGGFERAAYPRKTSLLITDGGDPIPAEDFPKMADWYLDGRLNLDDMVTRTLGLDELDEAFRAMLAGEVIRSVVRFDA
jgi:Zn-dependent alcohol dehydrogenase